MHVLQNAKKLNSNVKNGLGDLMSFARGVTDKMLDLIEYKFFNFI